MMAAWNRWRRWRDGLAPWAFLLGVVLLWLAPITLLGRMPIGGDVTSFFLPLMSYYHRALAAGRIPLWNELWGFGFPVLAESQTGVFYPPHLLLFGLLYPELAYALNIVLHTLLAGWFAYLCGRWFGLGRSGATLTGLVYAGNGFFVIHFPHQWSYTAGAWLPLAVGLAWRAAGRGARAAGIRAGVAARTRVRAALGLALVLAVQLLAGHFQIAFYTQVTILLVAIACGWQLLPALRRRRKTGPVSPAPRGRLGWGPACAPLAPLGWIAVPLAGAFALAAVQLLPSHELVRMALPEGRDFEYLSGFANTPVHLVSYLLPTLFHVNPLWRPVAWDPFHTSPEECFAYMGLLPLCLAAGAAWRWRREPRVRLWVFLVIATLLLSLGPYMPGFRLLIGLPGFSGFRASARWSLVTALFLALLAGRALSGAAVPRRLRRWLTAFTAVFAAVLLAAGVVAAALASGGSPGAARTLRVPAALWARFSPWPSDRDLLRAISRGSRPLVDTATLGKLAELGYDVRGRNAVLQMPGERVAGGSGRGRPQAGTVRAFDLATERPRVLLQELVAPAALLLVMWLGVFALVASGARLRPALLLLTAVDLGVLGWLRPTQFHAQTALTAASPVLEAIAAHGRGERTLDPLQNLAMVAGAAPVRSYRTVDLPILWTAREEWRAVSPQIAEAMRRRCGVRWEILAGPAPPAPTADTEADRAFDDPTLARIVFGGLADALPDWTTRFVLREFRHEASRAWFWDQTKQPERYERLISGRFQMRGYHPPLGALHEIETALFQSPGPALSPIVWEPERAEYLLEAEHAGAVLLTELDYPGWRATLVRADRELPAEMRTVAGGCRAVMVPSAGSYRVRLVFRSRAYELGRSISIAALIVWCAGAAASYGLRGYRVAGRRTS